MAHSIQVNVEGFPNAPVRVLREAVRRVLEVEGVEEGEVSLTLQSDARMRALNEEYLGHDRPTDVIAFALHEGDEPVLGDVYVGFDRAVAQAEERGIDLEEELARLAIHGVLHVLGHDHPDGDSREESAMYRLQEELLRSLLDGAS